MEQNKKGAGNGCLWIFLTFIFTVIGFGVLTFITGLPEILTLLLSLLFSIAFTYSLIGTPSLKSVGINFISIVLLCIGFRIVGSFLLDLTLLKPDHAVFTNEDSVTTDFIIENQDSISIYKSKRVWNDNYGNSFKGDLIVRTTDYRRLKNYMQNYNPNSTTNFWGGLYQYMYTKDSPSLDLVMEMFTQIHKEQNLNQMEFAEMVVSCIQDIPYSFVFQDTCASPDNYEDDIRYVLEDCPDCCIGGIPFGIQNPVSFIKNLKGDCDTRTVLLFSILNYFNYDVAIANSDLYRHSVLGINIPASGKQLKYRGKTYTLWETTAKYFTLGKLPASTSDTAHWNIVLTSK